MCNKRSEIGSEFELKSEVLVDQELQHLMDDSIVAPGTVPCSNEDKPRVKFLCSFSGSILPRPHDGKLRYVGGETRIVSLPCNITYNELMAKMREIYDGAVILKYQQPDEDLDALVSVVNDDDVTNMMEEYDKLGSGDGFTRLRIFLFSNSDLDGLVPFVDGDERESERRYMEALNSLNESPSYMRNHSNEAQVFGPADDGHFGVEQYFNQMNLEGGGLHNQRNSDLHLPPFHLRQLNIPPIMSAQSISQMESPWSAATSAAYHSPRQHGVLEPRQMSEYPTSPSSGRYRAQYAEISDKNFDRVHEEYMRNQTNQSHYEHQQQYNDNVPMFPTTVPIEKVGFPGNIIGSSNNLFDGSGVCNNCRVTFPRNQLYPEPLYQQLTEPQSMGNNGFHHVASPCAECPPNREMYMLNADTSIHHAYYPAEQIDPRHVYNDNQNRERGWTMQHQLTPRAEELRPHSNVDNNNNNMGISHGQVNLPDSHHVPLHLVHYDDPRYIRSGPEVNNQMFHDTALAAGSNVHIQPLDERGVRYANPSYGIRTEGFQVGHGHASSPPLWRNVQSPMHGGASYEPSGPPQLAISPGYIRMEGPKPQTGLENQNPWVESSPKNLGLDGEAHCLSNAYNNDNGHLHKVDAVHYSPVLRSFAAPLDPSLNFSPHLNTSLSFAAQLDPSATTDPVSLAGDKLAFAAAESVRLVRPSPGEHKGGVREQTIEPSSLGGFICTDQKTGSDGVSNPVPVNATLAPVARNNSPTKDIGVCVSVECDGGKSSANVDGGGIDTPHADVEEEHQNVPDAVDAHEDLDLDYDNENSKKSKIELTKAEEEALSRGLQTIRNEDLEEIRELGTGTYGAVFHGKWRGSDVAIKRIKASCFAGRPSERERLISDFWKEALILSSLHHPNVVSFYGVVRDGPDGSLATVTEFMVNGSLKQFLQKKDRTIDRRKRLLIAMDTAFGMEYLHGKSIVHFDLKCENLLVNMRDPHRPVCKIGDLGLSKVKQHTLVSGGVRGTLPWMAPELLSGKSNMVTEKIDVYSFGIVMWELLTGDEPYKDMHCASIIGGIVNNTLRPTIPTWCDPEWKSLMESSWSSDPALRPSFSEISQKLRSMAAAMNLK